MSDTRAAGTAAMMKHLASGDTGLLEIRDGKKKWRFHLDGGAIVATKSNLRSEQSQTIRDSRPDLSDGAVLRSVVIRQVRSICRVDSPVVQFLKGVTVREPSDIPTGTVLTKGAVAAWGEDALKDALQQVLEGYPRLTADLAAYRLPSKVEAHIGQMDGAQTGEEFLNGAPGRMAEQLAGLWLVWKMGGIQVRASLDEEEPDDGVGLDFDLGAMIAEGLDTDDRAPVPEDPSELEVEEIPMEALEEAPSASPASGGHVLSGMPSRRRPAAASGGPSLGNRPKPKPQPDKHPLEDKLKTLHGQIMAAENHFEVLSESWESDPSAFRSAHLKLAQELHPDRYSDAPASLQDLATEAFDRVRAAWEVLEDDEKRATYIDQKIHGKKSEDELAMEQLQNYWAAEKDFKRGKAVFRQGQVVQAHEMFRAAVDKVPDELEFRAFFGYTTYHIHKTKDRDAAAGGFEMLKEVLEINKEQERKLDEGWVLLGHIHRDEGRANAAKKCYMMALKINTGNGDAERELRRLQGGEPGKKKEEKPAAAESKKKRGWFGKKK